MPGFHVGGKTALAWHGLEHDIAFDEVLSLWGDRPKAIPAWIAVSKAGERLDFR
ncbi:hypothetical protein PV762_24175 [Mitsuaria sp. CC2]|uniref:hypothetical protein n=1 Tax=Mitsuaria sp. CC2 TaxID=3029186 RepID=UPI003B8E95E0